MSQAELRTPRLRLVPLADEHLEHEIALDSDHAVMRYLGNGRPRERAEVAVLHAARLAEATVVPGFGFWTGFAEVDGRSTFVGWWILGPYDGDGDGPVRADEAELGFRLLPRFWQQGLGSEGARELLRHGFEDLGLALVWAETMAVNEASRATMAALGLTHVRTYHPDFDEPIPGTEHGEVVYRITAAEWRRRLGSSPAS